MSPLELFEIVVGLIVLSLLVTTPIICIIIIPYIKSGICKLTSYLAKCHKEQRSSGATFRHK